MSSNEFLIGKPMSKAIKETEKTRAANNFAGEDCEACAYSIGTKPAVCLLAECEFIEGKIRKLKVSNKDVIQSFAEELGFGRLTERVSDFVRMHPNRSPFVSCFHRENFIKQVRHHKDYSNRELAILYLITSDEQIWSVMKKFVRDDGIQYHANTVQLKNDSYTIWKVVEDILGFGDHISMTDMVNITVIGNDVFWTLMNAMAIIRYGVGTVGISKGGD